VFSYQNAARKRQGEGGGGKTTYLESTEKEKTEKGRMTPSRDRLDTENEEVSDDPVHNFKKEQSRRPNIRKSPQITWMNRRRKSLPKRQTGFIKPAGKTTEG